MNENPQQPTGFFDGIRQANLMRSRQRWIGGVSHAIAARTRLDISLVRGLFVIAALFGVGFLLYGLCWLFLPEEGSGRIIAEDLGRGQVDGALIGIGVFIVFGLWAPFSLTNAVFGAPWMLIPNGVGLAILVIVLLVVIVKNSEQKGAGPGQYGSGPGGASAGDGSGGDAGMAGAAGGVGGTPPAAPNPDYPAAEAPTQRFSSPVPPAPPTPPPPPTPPGPTHKRASLTLVSAVVGAALIAAAFAALADVGSANVWVTPVGAGVIVLGAGIILAGFLGRSSSVLSPLALVALFITVSATLGWIGSGPVIGDVSYKPAELTASKTVKSTAVGSIDLNLLDVPRSDIQHEVDVNFAVGDASVMIPNDRHAVVTTVLSIGEVAVPDEPDGGPSGILIGKNEWVFGEKYSEEPELIVSVAGVVGDISITVGTPTTSEVHP